MSTRFALTLLVLVMLAACGPGGICDVTAGDLAGTYRLTVNKESGRELANVRLTFSETGVDLEEVDGNDRIHCETGTTAFCALDIRCSDKDGRPKYRFLWTGEGQ